MYIRRLLIIIQNIATLIGKVLKKRQLEYLVIQKAVITANKEFLEMKQEENRIRLFREQTTLRTQRAENNRGLFKTALFHKFASLRNSVSGTKSGGELETIEIPEPRRY